MADTGGTAGPTDAAGVADLDQDLLDILACPAPDHGPLVIGTPEDPGAPALTCTVCGRRFPVTDGIPVLLLSEASGGPGDGAERSSTQGPGATGGSDTAPAAAG